MAKHYFCYTLNYTIIIWLKTDIIKLTLFNLVKPDWLMIICYFAFSNWHPPKQPDKLREKINSEMYDVEQPKQCVHVGIRSWSGNRPNWLVCKVGSEFWEESLSQVKKALFTLKIGQMTVCMISWLVWLFFFFFPQEVHWRKK